MNLVFARHLEDRNAKGYLFEVPEGMKFPEGFIVRTETKRGAKLAECVSDTFSIENEQAVRILVKEVGGTFPLKRVIGIYPLQDITNAWFNKERDFK